MRAPDPEPRVSPYAFIDGALDRADALRDDPGALAAHWPQARIVLLDDDGRALADAQRRLLAPSGGALGGGPGTAIFLGLRDGVAWFAQRAETANAGIVAQAPNRVDLRSAATHWPAFDSTVFAQARAVLHWHARHRYCGVCGAGLRYERAGWLGRCSGCNLEHYPRTDQAIIVAVTDGRRLLLGRQKPWAPRRWSVLAGFVEPGESLEQTVVREVLEESGVRVRERECVYQGSQPWPFPSALMLGFIARAEPDEPVAGDELEEVRWFEPDQVRAGLAADWSKAEAEGEGIILSAPVSISRWLAERWLSTL